MPAHTSDRESCRKQGMILTCYVNGRKRFLAVPLNSATNKLPEKANAAHGTSGGSQSEPATVSRRTVHRF